MSQYINLVKNIYDNGRVKSDRTGVGTVSIFGAQMRFDLSEGLPVVTEKFTFMRGVIHELLWLIKGDTNIQYLLDNDVHIWDSWATKEDIFDEVTLSLYERVALRAEMQGITVAESQRRAEEDDHAAQSCGLNPSSQYGGAPNGGEKVLDDEGIPRIKKVLRVAKGSLGPVYGKQWRGWPNYRANKSVDLTLDQRIALFREKYKDSPTVVLRRDVGLPDTVSDADTYAELNDHNIPRTRTISPTIDQLAEAIDLLKTKPNSRRIIVSAWNPADNPDESIPAHVNAANGFAALNSCHTLFQFMAEPLTVEERARHLTQGAPHIHIDECIKAIGIYRDSFYNYNDPSREEKFKASEVALETMASIVDAAGVPKYRLSCQLYQRSADVTLGVPFNIASYALLTCMVAQVVNMVPGDFVHTLGDAHLYLSHLSPYGKHPGTAKEGADTIEDLLERKTLPFPKLILNPAVKNIDDFTFDDIKVVGYEHSGKMTFPVAV